MKKRAEKTAYGKEISAGGWLSFFFGVLFFGVLLCILAVAYIDPFFQYHAPLAWFPYQIDNQLSQNPGLAKHMPYDGILTGSSVTLNFHAAWFDEAYRCQTVKLPYNGAYPRDIRNIFEVAEKSGHTLRHVFLAVDEASYSGGTEEIKFPIPEYLYDFTPLNDIAYWLNKDVLLKYIVRPLAEASLQGTKGTDVQDAYATWQLYGYGKWVVFQSYMSPEKTGQVYPRDYYLDAVRANMEENILPLIRRHPECEFHVFYPPYSILYWYNYKKTEQIPAVIEKYKLLSSLFLAEKNVELFCFTADAEIVTELENYSDYEHFSREISRLIVEKMARGEHRLYADTLEQTMEEMRAFAENYDYDGIWEGWEEYLYEK